MSVPPRAAGKRGRSKKTNFRVGRVTCYIRGATWWIYYREDKTTKRVRVGPDKVEAERQAAEVNAQLCYGMSSYFGFRKVKIEDLIPRWLETHEYVLQSAPLSIERYRAATDHLLRFVRAHHPGLTADRLTVETAEEFVKYLRSQNVAPNGKENAKKRPLRDRGVVNILNVCRTVMNYAAKKRNLPPYCTNPFSELGFNRMRIEDSKQIVLFTPEEEAKFLEICDPWQFRVFFTLAFTGMRPGELMHVLVDDVDFESKTLHIRNHPELGWYTKTRKERRVFLFDELLDVVRDAVAGRTSGPIFRMRRFELGGDVPPLEDVPTAALAQELHRRIDEARSANGGTSYRMTEYKLARRLWYDMGAIRANIIRKEFMRLSKKMGRPEITSPYVLRHAMATAMQAADVDPFVRKEIIGHTSLAMVGRYTHTADLTLARGMKQAAESRPLALRVARERTTPPPAAARSQRLA